MDLIFWAASWGVGDQLKRALAAGYRFVLGLGGPGLFFLALADSSFLSIPEGNDLLIIVLSIGQSWSTMFYYVAMTTAGSVAGCLLLYLVGRRGGDWVSRRVSLERIERLGRLYRRWGVWAVVIPSVLPPPTPFKVFVLSAGVFRLPWPRFLFAVAAGRSFRYAFWGVMAVLYGEAAREYLEQNLHTVGVAIACLLIGAAAGFGLYRIVSKKKAAQSGAA